jgi:hypothetical protein
MRQQKSQQAPMRMITRQKIDPMSAYPVDHSLAKVLLSADEDNHATEG